MTRGRAIVLLLVAALAGARGAPLLHAQPPPPSNVDALHEPFDRLLDLYVRDGLVYYRAVQSERARFDRYVASLDVPAATYGGWSRERQLAFWINAYNAFVIETVLDRYPIRGRAPEYPANSVRQIGGAFDKLPHRAAGKSLTLDEIERTILSAFDDPRVFLALGRGSVGGGRLVSAAYTSGELERQLQALAGECVTRRECASVDVGAGTIALSPVFSWRQVEFVKAYGEKDVPAYPNRSPIERAVLFLLAPHLLPRERIALSKNDFTVTFQSYDWRLNDLTGGPPPR